MYDGWVPGMPAEIWHRTPDMGAYGRHRKTTAIAWVPKAKPPRKVSFVANVPVSATWLLEYHLPIAWSPSGYSDLTYNLSVHNDERDWNVPFDTSSEGVTNGWNSVEKFDLNAGTVIVDVLGTESRGLMFADAIRWTIVPDESEVKNIER